MELPVSEEQRFPLDEHEGMDNAPGIRKSDMSIIDIIKGNLPLYPAIMGKDRYMNSAVTVPLVELGNEWHLLFQLRAAGIPQEGEICFPGGRYDTEKDSDFRATAIRETSEELGIGEEKVRIIGQMDTLVASMGTTVDPFVAVLDIGSIDELLPNKAEVERIFTLPLPYLSKLEPEVYETRLEIHPEESSAEGTEAMLFPAKQLGLPERYHHAWGNRKMRVLVYRTREGIIWGMTAEILHDLLGRISLNS